MGIPERRYIRLPAIRKMNETEFRTGNAPLIFNFCFKNIIKATVLIIKEKMLKISVEKAKVFIISLFRLSSKFLQVKRIFFEKLRGKVLLELFLIFVYRKPPAVPGSSQKALALHRK